MKRKAKNFIWSQHHTRQSFFSTTTLNKKSHKAMLFSVFTYVLTAMWCRVREMRWHAFAPFIESEKRWVSVCLGRSFFSLFYFLVVNWNCLWQIVTHHVWCDMMWTSPFHREWDDERENENGKKRKDRRPRQQSIDKRRSCDEETWAEIKERQKPGGERWWCIVPIALNSQHVIATAEK